ncbi:MAG: hypothetical protein SVR08_14120, partial [Spirochaetota bacterium]|nr:hypothetical protein [Spirochaetota bacterium]
TLSNLTFINKKELKIVVEDPDGNEDEDLQKTFYQIFKDLRIDQKVLLSITKYPKVNTQFIQKTMNIRFI